MKQNSQLFRWNNSEVKTSKEIHSKNWKNIRRKYRKKPRGIFYIAYMLRFGHVLKQWNNTGGKARKKISEKLLLKQVKLVLEKVKLISNHQFGLRDQHGTIE